MISGKRILIVEDDAFLVKIISNRLTEEGFEVEVADDGEAALVKILNQDYTLIILDLIMPNKNGFEVLRQMKKDQCDTPTLVFSNLSQTEDKEEVMKLGAKGYYVKSDISVDEMVGLIKDFAQRKVAV